MPVAINTLSIRLLDIAGSSTIRLDPRYHFLRGLAQPLMDQLVAPCHFGQVASFSNGVNLPRSAYADELEDDSPLYASVAGIAPFILRQETCLPLRRAEPHGDRIAGTNVLLSTVKVRADEVLMTRSRATAPGVAWPGDLAPEGTVVVPAGFLIRASLRPSGLVPGYVAAILNHPAWRLLTAAFAAGKSQDNLSRELLAPLPIPTISTAAALTASERYAALLAEIDDLYRDETAFLHVCDGVLSGVLGLELPDLTQAPLQVASVSLSDVAATRFLRADNRWHGRGNRAIRDALAATPSIRLADLFDGPPLKGRQPTWASEDEIDEATPRAVATATIQAGTVAWERAKATTTQSVTRFPVQEGDLIVAMDGDGSLGKAAVYDRSELGTLDSHVARCRVRGERALADSISCYLNSSWGRVQTNGLMTGSTGQTQLNPADLLEVRVPAVVAQYATQLANSYDGARQAFEPVTRRARRLLARASADLTRQLVAEGALRASSSVEQYSDESVLLEHLDRLYPSNRV